MSLLKELLNERARLSAQQVKINSSIDAIDVLIKNLVPGITDVEDDTEMREIINHEKNKLAIEEESEEKDVIEEKELLEAPDTDFKKGERYKYVAGISFGGIPPDLTLKKSYTVRDNANRMVILDDKGTERSYSARTVSHYFEKVKSLV